LSGEVEKKFSKNFTIRRDKRKDRHCEKKEKKSLKGPYFSRRRKGERREEGDRCRTGDGNKRDIKGKIKEKVMIVKREKASPSSA